MRRLFWLFFINNNNHLICKCPRQFIEYSLVDIGYVPYWANGRPIKMLVGNAYTKLGYRVWHSNESEDFVLNCFYHFNLVLGYGFPSGSGVHLALSGGFGGTARPFMPHRCLFTRPTWARTTPSTLYKNPPLLSLTQTNTNQSWSSLKTKQNKEMKMGSTTMGGNKRRLSTRGLGGVLKEQRAKLYIIRRCVVMLLCWHEWTSTQGYNKDEDLSSFFFLLLLLLPSFLSCFVLCYGGVYIAAADIIGKFINFCITLASKF